MNKGKKNILIVTSEFPPLPGGIGNHAYNLSQRLGNRGYNITVITDQRAKSLSAEIAFDQKLNISVYRVALRKFRPIMYLNRLHLLFRHIKANDKVIASGKFSLWIVALVRIFYKRQCIAIVHGTEVNFKNSILRFSIHRSLRRFNKIIVVSEFTKSLIALKGYSEIVVIPNGFDKNLWAKLGVNDIDLKGNPKLITVGNVSQRKGQLNVIRQLPELKKAFPELHYHCVGIPAMKDNFLSIAKDLAVAESITFHGMVSNAKLKALLRASDVFIMLSGESLEGDVEGFGIAIIEANFIGLPAIGSKNCGIEDAINDNVSGLLIDPLKPKSIPEALTNIMLDYEQYSKMAYQWSLNFDWDLIIDRYIKVMDQ